MHVVIFSDIHLHKWEQFSHIDSKTGLNSRLLDGIDILEQIRWYCRDQDIDTIIFGGDMFERSTRLDLDLLSEFATQVVGMTQGSDIKMMMLPGQHDYFAQEYIINALKPFEYFYALMDRTAYWPISNEVNLITCLNRKDIKDQREDLTRCQVLFNRNYINIFLGHFLLKEILEADGVSWNADCVEFKDLPQGCDLYLLGDYHPHIWLPELKVMSIGATHHHTWKDKNRPLGGFIDLDLDTMEWKRVELQAPMFIELRDTDPYPPGHGYDTRDFYKIPTSGIQEEIDMRVRLGTQWNYIFTRMVTEEEVQQNKPRFDDVNFDTDPYLIMKKWVDHMGADEETLKLGKEFLK